MTAAIRSVAFLGAGTGVPALAAIVALGITRVFLLDEDRDALGLARHNALANLGPDEVASLRFVALGNATSMEEDDLSSFVGDQIDLVLTASISALLAHATLATQLLKPCFVEEASASRPRMVVAERLHRGPWSGGSKVLPAARAAADLLGAEVEAEEVGLHGAHGAVWCVLTLRPRGCRR